MAYNEPIRDAVRKSVVIRVKKWVSKYVSVLYKPIAQHSGQNQSPLNQQNFLFATFISNANTQILFTKYIN